MTALTLALLLAGPADGPAPWEARRPAQAPRPPQAPAAPAPWEKSPRRAGNAAGAPSAGVANCGTSWRVPLPGEVPDAVLYPDGTLRRLRPAPAAGGFGYAPLQFFQSGQEWGEFCPPAG